MGAIAAYGLCNRLPEACKALLISVYVSGDDDEDELVPLKLKETKRFRDRQVIGLEIGGQMAFILSTTKTESVAANANAAHGASHTPPEPAPADALS